MTIQQLEAAKKLQDAINANNRVLEHLNRSNSEPDKTDRLVEFLTRCGNLQASISKKDLADILFSHLISTITDRLEADKKALDAL